MTKKTQLKKSKYMFTLGSVKNHGAIAVQLYLYENRIFLFLSDHGLLIVLAFLIISCLER